MAKNSNTYKTFNIHERTPIGFYNQINNEFNFDFDPCPLNNTPIVDGLNVVWGRRCFINPPYGKAIRTWLEKALLEIEKGNTDITVFLLPAYTDVKWFHEIVLEKASEIRFLKGRLKFGEHNNTAPFASMLVIFDKSKEQHQADIKAIFDEMESNFVRGTEYSLVLARKNYDKLKKKWVKDDNKR